MHNLSTNVKRVFVEVIIERPVLYCQEYSPFSSILNYGKWKETKSPDARIISNKRRRNERAPLVRVTFVRNCCLNCLVLPLYLCVALRRLKVCAVVVMESRNGANNTFNTRTSLKLIINNVSTVLHEFRLFERVPHITRYISCILGGSRRSRFSLLEANNEYLRSSRVTKYRFSRIKKTVTRSVRQFACSGEIENWRAYYFMCSRVFIERLPTCLSCRTLFHYDILILRKFEYRYSNNSFKRKSLPRGSPLSPSFSLRRFYVSTMVVERRLVSSTRDGSATQRPWPRTRYSIVEEWECVQRGSVSHRRHVSFLQLVPESFSPRSSENGTLSHRWCEHRSRHPY